MPTAVEVLVAFGGLAWPSAVAVVDGDVRLCVREVAVVAVTVDGNVWVGVVPFCSLHRHHGVRAPMDRCIGGGNGHNGVWAPSPWPSSLAWPASFFAMAAVAMCA